MNFYRKFDVKYLPKIVQKYLFQCFLINQMIISKSERNYFKTVILLNKKKVIENQFYNEMKKHGYDWNSRSILAHFIGKNPEDVLKRLVTDSFEKIAGNRTIAPKDKRTMEIIIKNAYVEFANYLDDESQKK